MVWYEGAAVGRLVAWTGAKAAHCRAQQGAPAPAGEGVELMRSITVLALLGQQRLATVMHIWIIVGAKAVVAAVAAVVAAAAVAAPQTQTEQIAVVVRRIGEVLKIQM